MNEQHIASAYDRDLEAIQAMIIKMGGLVEEAILDGSKSLEMRDTELAEKVRAGDKAIDDLEERINEESARTIALRAPVSKDLRIVLSVLRLAASLERVGDFAAFLGEPFDEALTYAALRKAESVGRPIGSAEWLADMEARTGKVLAALNVIGGKHGIGRLDIVENRYVGMKSRGCYETPGGTIMLKGHRAIESITMDREVLALKDDLMPRYARMIYNGYWFSPERQLLQGLIDASQATVNGRVRPTHMMVPL